MYILQHHKILVYNEHLFKLLFSLCSKRWHCNYVVGQWLGSCVWRITDSSYIKQTKIFETQQSVASHDITSSQPFPNLFDCGYHVILDAHQHGGQHCVQPSFSWHNKNFETKNVLYSAAVAMVRSGNERAVKQVKTSWKHECTFQATLSLDMLANIWIAWGFQVNFSL